MCVCVLGLALNELPLSPVNIALNEDIPAVKFTVLSIMTETFLGHVPETTTELSASVIESVNFLIPVPGTVSALPSISSHRYVA